MRKKKIFQNGTSSVVSLTKELRELDAEIGDEVQVTVVDGMVVITDKDADIDGIESALRAVNNLKDLSG